MADTDPRAQPVPIAVLDARRHNRPWISVAVAGLLFCVVGALLGFLLVRVLETNTSGECAFYREIATLPVVVTPTADEPRTPQLSVRIIIDSRHAYIGLQCGTLPPPPRGLLQLSLLYHIPL